MPGPPHGPPGPPNHPDHDPSETPNPGLYTRTMELRINGATLQQGWQHNIEGHIDWFNVPVLGPNPDETHDQLDELFSS